MNIRLPRGISIRHNKRGDTLEIEFRFDGRNRRENLGLAPTEGNIWRAARIRAEILNDIAREIFTGDVFPDSPEDNAAGVML